MSKTNSPRRQPTYKTVQFWLAGLGGWLVLTGNLVSSNTVSDPPIQTQPTKPTTIRVEPARQQPGDTANQLQNAGGLQRQTAETLQRPTNSDQLQPNAKTDSFGSPSGPTSN